jgi:hypothetical protein
MPEETCPKCQSRKMIPAARIVDQAGHFIRLAVSVDEKPDALIFKGAHTQLLRARICGACGNVELYVDDPEELHSVYQASGTRAE